ARESRGRRDELAGLLPAVGVLRETGALDPDDAKALTARGFHHHPALEPTHDFCAQLAQTGHFRGNIVCLDVEVNTALVLQALDLHDGLIGRCLQHAVVATRAGMTRVHWTTQRVGPETGRRIDIVSLTVDQHGAKPGLVHEGAPSTAADPTNYHRDPGRPPRCHSFLPWALGRTPHLFAGNGGSRARSHRCAETGKHGHLSGYRCDRPALDPPRGPATVGTPSSLAAPPGPSACSGPG